MHFTRLEPLLVLNCQLKKKKKHTFSLTFHLIAFGSEKYEWGDKNITSSVV